MADFETFPRAPIVEALLDVQVTFPTEIAPETFQQFGVVVKSEFPNRSERVAWKQHLSFDPSGPNAIATAKTTEGWMFEAADKSKIVQARVGGFTYNKLKPYQDWPALRDEAKSLWQRWSELTKPIRVNRIALRYINRIELPAVSELTDYVTLLPTWPQNFPDTVNEFFFRWAASEASSGANANILLTSVPVTPDSKTFPLIFDLDVYFRFENLPATSEEMWAKFEQLREFKNRLFLSGITERAKELFR